MCTLLRCRPCDAPTMLASRLATMIFIDLIPNPHLLLISLMFLPDPLLLFIHIIYQQESIKVIRYDEEPDVQQEYDWLKHGETVFLEPVLDVDTVLLLSVCCNSTVSEFKLNERVCLNQTVGPSLLDKQSQCTHWGNTGSSSWILASPPASEQLRLLRTFSCEHEYTVEERNIYTNITHISVKLFILSFLHPSSPRSFFPLRFVHVADKSMTGIWWRHVSFTCHNSPARPNGSYVGVRVFIRPRLAGG